tara:strand:- start:668 stop:1045 length:378 start_codon:yes stop_codon:yes gene_type:complete
MPIYTYKHPTEERYKEVIQGMNDDHTYSEDGVKWGRVWDIPNAAISSNADPFSQNSFVEKTANMKGTFGDMMDYSAELSEKRASESGGEDPLKKKLFKDYEKRVGKKHVADKKVTENKSIKVDYD